MSSSPYSSTRRNKRQHSRSPSFLKRPRESHKVFFVAGISSKLHESYIEDILLQEYSIYGDVSVRLSHEGDTHTAFLTFKHSEHASRAFRAKEIVEIASKICKLQIYDSSERRPLKPHPVEVASDPHCVYPSSAESSTTRKFDNESSTFSDHSRFLRPKTRKEADEMPESNLFCHLVLHPKASRTLFVGSLEPDIQEHEIIAFFCPFGHIEHVDIKRPPPGNPSAYAFVRFENIDMTARAKMLMNGQNVRATHCKIGFGKPAPSKSVYVGGLASSISSETLFDVLTKFGSLNYFFYEVGQNFAIASYINEEMASTAVSKLRGHKMENFDSEIYLDFAGLDIPLILMQNISLVKAIIATNKDSLALFSIRELAFFPAPVPSQRKRLFDSSFLRSIVPCKFEQDNQELCQISTIAELRIATEPSIGTFFVTLKSSFFPFESFHLAGNRELSGNLFKGQEARLSIKKRLNINSISVSETVEAITRSFNEKPTSLSLVLGVSKHTSLVKPLEDNKTMPRPLACLVAYLRLKNSIALMKSYSSLVVLFPPGSFALCLLKLVAPKLPCDAVTLNDYIVLVICKNKSK